MTRSDRAGVILRFYAASPYLNIGKTNVFSPSKFTMSLSACFRQFAKIGGNPTTCLSPHNLTRGGSLGKCFISTLDAPRNNCESTLQLPDDTPRAEERRRRAPPLAEPYRKAYKSYVLTSGLLAAWELIGPVLDTKEKWGIEFKSPSAVPLILFTLVFYLGYKMTVEWLQCGPMSRRHPAARIDYRVAHSIALIAVLITLLQYLWRFQIVELANRWFSKERDDVLLVISLGVLGIPIGWVDSWPWRIRDILHARSEGVSLFGVLLFRWKSLLFAPFLFLGALMSSLFYCRQVWARGVLHFAASSVIGLCALLASRRVAARQAT